MTPEPVKPPKSMDHIEPIVIMIFAGMVFFALLLVAISKWSPNDGQTFQVVAGMATGLSGAFLTRVRPPEPNPKPDTKTVTIERTDTST